MGKTTLAWDGWFQQWLADGNTRETELHCLYGQPESTVPASLFCTCLGQQQEHLLRRLFCVLSVVCPVLWQMGSSGWCAGWMERLPSGQSLWCISYSITLDLNSEGCFRKQAAQAAGQLALGLLWHCHLIVTADRLWWTMSDWRLCEPSVINCC